MYNGMIPMSTSDFPVAKRPLLNLSRVTIRPPSWGLNEEIPKMSEKSAR